MSLNFIQWSNGLCVLCLTSYFILHLLIYILIPGSPMQSILILIRSLFHQLFTTCFTIHARPSSNIRFTNLFRHLPYYIFSNCFLQRHVSVVIHLILTQLHRAASYSPQVLACNFPYLCYHVKAVARPIFTQLHQISTCVPLGSLSNFIPDSCHSKMSLDSRRLPTLNTIS